MAVLKIVPKLYQEKISEKLKEEISLVTNGEAKYYNRLYKFFQNTDIQCTADINYDTRKMYMDSLEKEEISEKYRAELLSLFDRLKIENMPDVYSQGKPFSVEQEFFKQDKLFLLYVPNKKKAQSFRQVVDKNDLLWDLTGIHSSQLVRQTKVTGLSRGFFYNNPNVKQVMMELKEKQQGQTLRNPKSDAIAKAQEARIKSLEQKLSDSVPKSEYENLQKKYEELQVKYSQVKNGTLLKLYEQL